MAMSRGKWTRSVLATFLIASSAPAQPQAGDQGLAEVVVTAMRREADDYDERVPAIGLRKVADFAVQEVSVVGDTREAAKRNDEIFAMVRNAIDAAGKRGLMLATGEMVVEPLTLANYRNLELSGDGRPDTGRVRFLVKVPLSQGVDGKAAVEKITAFVKAVPSVGRAEMREAGDLTLSIVQPDSYRGQIAELVATDARAMAAKLGQGYGVEVKGLDRPVEWTRASLTDVFLYMPYSYVITPVR